MFVKQPISLGPGWPIIVLLCVVNSLQSCTQSTDKQTDKASQTPVSATITEKEAPVVDNQALPTVNQQDSGRAIEFTTSVDPVSSYEAPDALTTNTSAAPVRTAASAVSAAAVNPTKITPLVPKPTRSVSATYATVTVAPVRKATPVDVAETSTKSATAPPVTVVTSAPEPSPAISLKAAAPSSVDLSTTTADCSRLRKKTLAKLNDPNEIYKLGRCLQASGDDQDDALPCFEKAASSGHAASNYELGRAMLNDNTSPRDAQQAIRRLESAAQAGMPEAQWLLGSTLMTGTTNVPRDREKGKRWLNMYKNQSPQ